MVGTTRLTLETQNYISFLEQTVAVLTNEKEQSQLEIAELKEKLALQLYRGSVEKLQFFNSFLKCIAMFKI